MVFVYKTKGYEYSLLPKLVPCPVAAGEKEELVVTSFWLPAAAGDDATAKDEL